ncbi:hypothetical protein NMG60_11020493 [Bertholletia excelsa]
MKRERAVQAATRKKKAKGKAEEKKAVAEEEKKEHLAAQAVAALLDRDESLQRWSVVEEQMSWGSLWCPSWDIEYLDEDYNDDVWDHDIWNLKSITKVPNP